MPEGDTRGRAPKVWPGPLVRGVRREACVIMDATGGASCFIAGVARSVLSDASLLLVLSTPLDAGGGAKANELDFFFGTPIVLGLASVEASLLAAGGVRGVEAPRFWLLLILLSGVGLHS